MSLSRRRFFKTLAGGLAGTVLSPYIKIPELVLPSSIHVDKLTVPLLQRHVIEGIISRGCPRIIEKLQFKTFKGSTYSFGNEEPDYYTLGLNKLEKGEELSSSEMDVFVDSMFKV